MISFLISTYVSMLALLLILDVTRGVFDAAQRRTAVEKRSRQAWAPFKRAFSQLLAGFIHARRERANMAYGACTWERCDSLVSGAGKAIAMK